MNSKNNKYKILLLVIVCALLAGCANAGDISYKIVKKSGYFTAGYDPESYHTYGGYGLAVNVVKFAAERMGVEAPITPVNDYDWSAHMQNEDIDMMLCKEPDSGQLAVQVFSDNIVLMSADPENIASVGVIDSDACIEQKNALSYQTAYQFTYYSDPALLTADLKNGTVDAALMSEYDALAKLSASEYNVQVLSEAPIYFVVPQNKQTFFDAISAVLNGMQNDGTTARLKQEYISSLE
jgi:hypothetical protein